jgi:serine/threonine-protein kinase
MSEAICKGCGAVMDTTGIEPFTLCECSECGMDITIPFQLDYLLLEKFIGRKSFIDIYEGFDKSSNVNSTIMVLDNEADDYATLLDIAKDEANSISTLKHPNTLPILLFDEILGNFCVVTPLMDGYVLSDYAPEEQGLLNLEQILDVMQAAALGLAIAHKKEFPHHNVCPENIGIDARGNVRVKNFFLSRFIYRADQKSNKVNEVIKCDSSVSPYFISPEKAESGIEDKRGDVFSFGATMYFMLTGKYPFSGRSDIETVYSRVKQKKKPEVEVFSEQSSRLVTPDTVEYAPPKPPNTLRPEIPEEISSLIMDMLAYLPVKRPTFAEILAIFNLWKAKKYKETTVLSAQKVMVTTKTRAIPKMGNMGKKKKKK